jgi:hypothetical protein
MHKSDSDLLIKIMNEEEDSDFGKLINRQKHIGNDFEAIGF